MATIIKRKKRYSVIYRYVDKEGNERQKWETFDTMAQAKKRKLQVESQMDENIFIPPQATTVANLLEEYMSTYGVNSLSISTYSSKQGLILNYINPIIGDMKVQDITPKTIDKFYQNLLTVECVSSKLHHPRNKYVTPKMVREIHKILRTAFNTAVKWEIISRNPCLNASLPKAKSEERKIWDAETLFKAIDLCEDDNLKLALNLAFSCSLRMGEMLGLTWDCVEISEKSIEKGESFIFVNKEIQRVNRDVLETLGNRDIIFQFPQTIGGVSTVLVLKTPKTRTSIRKVYLPKTVAGMLRQRKAEQDELKEIMGNDYIDYRLVFAGINGRPMEGSAINREMVKLIEDNDLPHVVFHSIRHTSITYKLKLTGGDVKAVQGDSGHAQASMVTEVYSHVLDESRQHNASLIEDAFYKNETTVKKSLPQENESTGIETNPAAMNEASPAILVDKAASPEKDKETQTAKAEDAATDKGNSADKENDLATLMRLLQNPELAGVIKGLASVIQ